MENSKLNTENSKLMWRRPAAIRLGLMTNRNLENELAQSRNRVRRLEAVVEAALMVNSTLDLAQLAEHIVDIATRLIGAERGSLFLVEPKGGGLASMVAQGVEPTGLRLEVGEGIVGAVAASGEAEILDDPYADPRFDSAIDHATGFRTRSLLTVPVRDGEGSMVAVLQLLNRRRGDFSREDVEFLAELGVPFAIALTTAQPACRNRRPRAAQPRDETRRRDSANARSRRSGPKSQGSKSMSLQRRAARLAATIGM